MAGQDPLARQIEVVSLTDSEMRNIANNAAREAQAITTRLGPANVRSIQANLAALNTQMWAGFGDAARVGIGDAVYSAAEYQALFDQQLMSAAGLSNAHWRSSMLATAQQGAENLISRAENGIALSDRVWKNDQLSRKALNDTINTGLALNKGPREIAADVAKYLRPDVPGGASSAALRLGRSEVLNAYHATSVRKYQETPWVDRVKWNLSGSHPRPDECNEYAEQVTFRGGGNGVWKPEEVPGKPHPNCLCYITPVVMDLDEYAKNFKAGKYDDYIDRQMGCARV